MEQLCIRQASPADKPALLALEQKLIEAERPMDPVINASSVIYYDMDGLLTHRNSCLMVAELDAEIVGCGYAQIRPSKVYHRHDHHSYLGFMYVKPGHRGLGINKKILDALIAWSSEQGVADFYLNVYVSNDPAIRAYEKAGFVQSMVEMKLHLK